MGNESDNKDKNKFQFFFTIFVNFKANILARL